MARRSSRYSRGFTLIELIVVIAILGILASALIPSITGRIKQANKAACMSNLALAERLIDMRYALEEDTSEAGVAELLTGELGAATAGTGFTGICPGGGTYVVTLYETYAKITCSVHGASAVQEVNLNVGKLLEISLKNYFNLRPGSKELDSTGPNFGGDIKQQLIDELGLGSQDFDFRIYKAGGNEYHIYIFEPLEGLSAGSTVTATKYVLDASGNQRSVTEGRAPVKISSTKDVSGQLVEYLVLHAEQFTAS